LSEKLNLDKSSDQKKSSSWFVSHIKWQRRNKTTGMEHWTGRKGIKRKRTKQTET